MAATIECPHCGNELTSIKYAAGKWSALLMLPLFLFFVWMALRPVLFSPDIHDDLSIRDVKMRISDTDVEITGLALNSGKHRWSGVSIEAEFFDESGGFLDQASTMAVADIGPQEEDHFKISQVHIDSDVLSRIKSHKVRINGGHSFSF